MDTQNHCQFSSNINPITGEFNFYKNTQQGTEQVENSSSFFMKNESVVRQFPWLRM